MCTYSKISFIRLFLKRSRKSLYGKCTLSLRASIILLLFSVITQVSPVHSQAILFDFDNAPIFTSLPIYQTAGGITAHLSATGQGYSIQNANVLGFTPVGFAGRIIYPNSINLSDLMIHYDQTITDFSIMYCCQELACDDAATMQVRAYMNGSLVGSNTRIATFPGTWPVDTLRCSFPQGFDSVVVHYLHPPPTCQDYGTIFMADNMRITPYVSGITSESETPLTFTLLQNYPNPFNPATEISFILQKDEYVMLKVYDAAGNEIKALLNEQMKPGNHKITFDASSLPSGVYFYAITAGGLNMSKKMVLIK